ncbi:hypothetical protein ACI7YQ_10515 [Alteromonas marina]
MNKDISAMNPIFVLPFLFLMIYLYDKTIEKEVREHPNLRKKLEHFKWYSDDKNSASRIDMLCFKFWGITPSINIMGSITVLVCYFTMAYFLHFFFINFTA